MDQFPLELLGYIASFLTNYESAFPNMIPDTYKYHTKVFITTNIFRTYRVVKLINGKVIDCIWYKANPYRCYEIWKHVDEYKLHILPHKLNCVFMNDYILDDERIHITYNDNQFYIRKPGHLSRHISLHPKLLVLKETMQTFLSDAQKQLIVSGYQVKLRHYVVST